MYTMIYVEEFTEYIPSTLHTYIMWITSTKDRARISIIPNSPILYILYCAHILLFVHIVGISVHVTVHILSTVHVTVHILSTVHVTG